MMKAEDEGQRSPYQDAHSKYLEIFGKLKRAEEPSVKDLMTWGQPEVAVIDRRESVKQSNWVSESHDAFKCFIPLNPSQVRPGSAFTPKPIPDTEADPRSGAENISKQGSNSPKARRKSQSPKQSAPKTPNAVIQGTKRQLERIKKLHQTTRWLPNSAFKTYFGKPIFANYGQANTNPAYGGLMYGDYMKTHNIAPHEGQNNPDTQQVYELAESKGLQRSAKPQNLPRKCKDEDRLPPEEIEKLKKRSEILSKSRSKASKPIVKPDLLKEKVFKSEHNTPDTSLVAQEISKNPSEKKALNKSTKTLPKKSEESKKSVEIALKPSEEPIIDPLEVDNQGEDLEAPKSEDAKSHDVEVQVEDCKDCNEPNYGRLIRTSYQAMTSKAVVDKSGHIVEPYKYCVRCRDNLFNDDLMRPPYSLAEIPPQELDPKTYKNLPPKWTQRIPAAGKLSYRSPSAYGVIFGDNLPIDSL